MDINLVIISIFTSFFIMTSFWSLSASRLATYNRQKCINLLEKTMKNLFRMFRNQKTTKEQLIVRFSLLKKQIDDLGNVILNTDYHREMRIYIDQISHIIWRSFDLDEMRSRHMSKLNHIQKIKNAGAYKKDKHTEQYI